MVDLKDEIALIHNSGLFDADWYLAEYADVAATGLDPAEHYLRVGARLGRRPGPAFNVDDYLASHPDLVRSRTNPLLHYLRAANFAGRPQNQILRLREHSNPTQQRIAIAAHIFYPELWPELRAKLIAVKGRYDLFMTLPEHLLEAMSDSVRRDFPGARFFAYDGAGMDVGPFLELIPMLVAENYDCVCKIHTKKGNAELGRIWREVMLDGVIGNGDVFAGITEAFSQYPELGLVGPAPTYKSAVTLMYENEADVKSLFSKLRGREQLPSDWGFFAGTFFWARPQIFSGLAAVVKNEYSFEQSVTSSDGTLAHAVERLVGLLPDLCQLRTGLVHPPDNGQDEYLLEIAKSDQRGAKVGITETLKRILSLDEDTALLKQSQVFDPEWYALTYPECRAINMEPEHHYLLYGEARGYSVNKDFNIKNHLKWNKDVAQAGISLLVYYLRFGAK